MAQDRAKYISRAKAETERREAEESGASFRAKRERRHRPPVSRIPWALLDELEAAKFALKADKAVAAFTDTK